jgi:ABC-type transporter Mla maintaining outer membrane lipid asymmetry ATPase subunit MlaF
VIEMIDGVVESYTGSGIPLVEGVDWRIMRGDYWVVGGVHGSGKTDLLSTAAGLIRPAQGRHFLFGKETEQLGGDELARERLRIGIVFELGGRLFNHLTVRENVSLAICYHRDCDEADADPIVRPILEATGLEDVADQTPGRITRSLRQRVGLARALALHPEVLLLDNPISGLEPRHVRWWLEFMQALGKGHPLLENRPMTLVVAVGDLRPWIEQGKQFALLDERRWRPVGGQAELAGCDAILLQELLAMETKE